jgi:hypothetical protein
VKFFLMTPLLLYLFCEHTVAQIKIYSKTAVITFHSTAPLENISAKNNAGLCVWSMADGNIEFSVLMKGFEFAKALMQEHFNENYVESDRYPKATFKGVVEESKEISLTTDQERSVVVNGALTIHGVTHRISVPVMIKVKDGIISSSANFSITLADYDIKIPAIATGHINREISIEVFVAGYKKLN